MISRRSFVQGSAALSALWIGGAKAATAANPPASIPYVVDASSDVSGSIAALKQRGVNTVFRYYASRWQHELPTKRIGCAEANAILGAGLNLCMAYQYRNNEIASFNPTKAHVDIDAALAGAYAIGQPAGSAIYFGVDGDWPNNIADIVGYFAVLKQGIEANPVKYRLGVYGSGRSCSALKDYCSLFWLTPSQCFADTSNYFNSNAWNIFQEAPPFRIGKNDFDASVINPERPDFGQFGKPTQPIGKDDLVRQREMFRFSTEIQLPLHAGPGEASAKVGTIARGKSVKLLSVSDNWAAIDINADGTAEGYCQADKLAKTMPAPLPGCKR